MQKGMYFVSVQNVTPSKSYTSWTSLKENVPAIRTCAWPKQHNSTPQQDSCGVRHIISNPTIATHQYAWTWMRDNEGQEKQMWTPPYKGVGIFSTALEGNSNGRIDTNALERHCEHFTACLSVVCATDPKWVSWNGLRLGLPSAMAYRFGGHKGFWIFTKWGSQWDAIISTVRCSIPPLTRRSIPIPIPIPSIHL